MISNALLIFSYLSRRESEPTGTCEFSKSRKSIGDGYSDVLPHATTTLGSQHLLCTCYRRACFWLGTLLAVLYVVDSDGSGSHRQVTLCRYDMSTCSTAREIRYDHDLLVHICCCDYAIGHIFLHRYESRCLFRPRLPTWTQQFRSGTAISLTYGIYYSPSKLFLSYTKKYTGSTLAKWDEHFLPLWSAKSSY